MPRGPRKWKCQYQQGWAFIVPFDVVGVMSLYSINELKENLKPESQMVCVVLTLSSLLSFFFLIKKA